MVDGIAYGSLYALIGLGFVLIYRASGVVNFAQGEFMMLGAFISYSITLYFRLPFVLSWLISILFLFLLGMVVERYMFRRLRNAKVFSIVMVTIGLSAVLRGIGGMIWGHDLRNMPFPSEGEVIHLGSVNIYKVDLYAMITAFMILIVFSLFLRFHKVGRAIQGVSSDLEGAYLSGVPVDAVFGFSWGLSAAVSAVAGVYIGSTASLQPAMGVFALSAFPAIILGGLTSITGAVIGGMIMGVVVNVAGGYLSAWIPGETKEVVAYVVLLLLLMIRPNGLFGQKEIRRM